MFETSLIRAGARHSVAPMTVSIIAHSVVITAIIAVGLTSATLPKNPPAEFKVWFPSAAIPQPPAPPRAPAPSQPQPATPTAATTAPRTVTAPALTAPQQIPSVIPNVQPSGGTDIGAPNNGNVSPSGSDIGDPNGVDIGQGTGTGPMTTDTVFIPNGEVHSAIVLHRVEPRYPNSALGARLGGTVVLKCIIDKNGEVREAAVVTSSFAAFDQPALDALRQWKFAPGSLHGKPVDTWFELTIRFLAR